MRSLRTILVISSLLAPSPAFAASISYDAPDNRPVHFEGLMLKGTVYDVSVSWDGSYSAAYSVLPRFFGDETGAGEARDALRDALIADGYVGTVDSAVLDVPYTIAFSSDPVPPVRGKGLDISSGNLYGILTVETFPSDIQRDVGFTVWDVATSVPVPASVWLLASAMVGLAGVRRSRRKGSS